jgi:oligopeptide/dipeptide ABC transporter ATP-binding protein
VEETILQVNHLKTYFHTRNGVVKAVDDVNFEVKKGEILGIVGESGCGKSVTSQSILRLIGQKKSEVIEGEILYKGKNLLDLSEAEMQTIRGKHISMIFQDPMTSLNPVYTIGDQISEIPIIHEKKDKKSAWKKAVEMLKKVGIPSPEDRAKQYPHQYSGGMRQRAVIAMSLTGNPDVLIADEPTTALDVTIQAQVLDLIKDLRESTNTAVILITHDLGVVAETCDTVAVMYAGKVVEKAPVEELFENPRHPYTIGLLGSVPKPGSKDRLTPIKGQPPNLHDLPKGCRFANRCPHAFDKCLVSNPELVNTGASQHEVACFLEEKEVVVNG